MLCSLLCTTTTSAQFEQFENLEESTSKGFWETYFKNFFNIKNYVNYNPETPFSLNSDLSFETRFYNSNVQTAQQTPLYWVLNSNINFNLYGFDIPFSALISRESREFTKPQGPQLPNLEQTINNRFTRIGASPTYKWVTLHFGHRAMDLSQYTMSSLPFFGYGAELTPGPWRFSFFKGQLAEAQPRDLSLLEPNLPIFSQSGYGFKFGYGNDQGSIDVVLFKAGDDANSIEFTEDLEINPEDNAAYSFIGSKTLGPVNLRAEYAASALTLNSNDLTTGSTSFPFSFLGDEMRPSREMNKAIDLGIDFTAGRFVTGLQYKRVDDGYKTLGIPFINNDIQELSANLASQLLKGKIQYNVSAGLQSDNISGLKDQTVTRFIGALNASYTQDAFNISVDYNNNSFTTDYLLSADLDSLDAVTVTRNLGINMSYSIESDSGFTQNFIINTAIADVTDDLESSNAESTMYNATFTYGVQTPSKWSLNATVGYNNTSTFETGFDRILYGVGLRKSFLEEKLDFSAQYNFFTVNINQANNSISNNAANGLIQLNVKPGPAISFFGRYNLIRRGDTLAQASENVIESIANIGCRWNFSYQKSKKATEDNEE